MRHDKKVQGGRITFVLARGVGQAFLARDVDLSEVSGLLEQALAA
jgi:3-dehydroquinate synthetase